MIKFYEFNVNRVVENKFNYLISIKKGNFTTLVLLLIKITCIQATLAIIVSCRIVCSWSNHQVLFSGKQCMKLQFVYRDMVFMPCDIINMVSHNWLSEFNIYKNKAYVPLDMCLIIICYCFFFHFFSLGQRRDTLHCVSWHS